MGSWVQICFLSILENLVIRQFGYPVFYQAISIKSTFEPITTPLKWLLADAACKVSMIFFNIAPVWAGNCKVDCQNSEFYSRVLLFTTSSFLLYILLLTKNSGFPLVLIVFGDFMTFFHWFLLHFLIFAYFYEFLEKC